MMIKSDLSHKIESELKHLASRVEYLMSESIHELLTIKSNQESN